MLEWEPRQQGHAADRGVGPLQQGPTGMLATKLRKEILGVWVMEITQADRMDSGPSLPSWMPLLSGGSRSDTHADSRAKD